MHKKFPIIFLSVTFQVYTEGKVVFERNSPSARNFFDTSCKTLRGLDLGIALFYSAVDERMQK